MRLDALVELAHAERHRRTVAGYRLPRRSANLELGEPGTVVIRVIKYMIDDRPR